MENTVTGKVIVTETGLGIADLVVVIYDLDPNSQSEESFSAIVANRTNAPQFDFWERFQSDRIGSVLTDPNGRFFLKYDDSAFRIRNANEKRPDLVLLIMAPEDSPSDSAIPLSTPPLQQILHFSYVPRANSGRVESYVIRLGTDLLERFKIRIPHEQAIQTASDLTSAASSYVDNILAPATFSSEIARGVSEHFTKELESRKERLSNIRKETKKLSAIPRQQRQSPFFVHENASDRRIRRSAALAIENGMERIRDYSNLIESRSPYIVHLEDRELTDLGLEMDESAPTEISVEVFCSLMHRNGSGYDLTRVRSALAGSGASIPAEPESSSDENPAGSGNGTGENTVVDIEAEIQSRVLGQLQDLAEFELRDGDVKDPLIRLKETLDSLQKRTGPANVTAVRDFHSLQIAFKDVWTETFDPKVKGLVEQLYDGFVALHEEHGLELPPAPQINEIADLQDFLENAPPELLGLSSYPISPSIMAMWPDAADKWHLLNVVQMTTLRYIAASSSERMFVPGYGNIIPIESSRDEKIEAGRVILANPAGTRHRITRLLADIGRSLSEKYSFEYFKPDQINYGILATYRQEWTPGAYQVGDLVTTIPLAPGESRKFSKKESIKRNRSTKEIEKAMSTRRGESTQTRRAEAEILDKVNATSNFKMTAQGSFSFGFGSSSTSTEFALNQAQESAQTKKDFREAVLKASFEYKNERTLEISTSDEATAEFATSGELKNPNNELTVTYLIYELERQFQVRERIHRLTPVVLVAQDVPGPHEISEGWLLKHEWIIRRVLLDDALHESLDHISSSFAGDELSLNIKEQNWNEQKLLVKSLKSTVDTHLAQRDSLRSLLISTEETRGRAAAADEAEGFFSDFGDFLTGDNEEFDIANLDVNLKALRAQLDYINSTLQDTQERLTRSQESLNQATREYTDALEVRTNRRVAIDQLRIHVKENILYYMQAIWDHEPPDQRFFRLYNKRVFVPRVAFSVLTIRPFDPETDGADGIPGIEHEGRPYVIESESGPIPDISNPDLFAELIEIADLDNPLGYKGNYIVFPLKTCTFITDLMMREFVDGHFGIRDPDALAEFTSDEILAYVNSVSESLPPTERNALNALIAKRLTNPKRESDQVVVPTGQTYMEALLGDQPLLEPFKMAHRGYDASKARAELREKELENLRLAARLLSEEPYLDDPHVDKLIKVNGVDEVSIAPE